jgi:hypothetical protein
MATKRYDYDAMFARQTSTITTIVDGKSVTMSLKEWQKINQPNKGKRTKKHSKVDDGNSVTRLEEEVAAIEKGLKYVKSLNTYCRKGYRMWGTIHTQVVSIDGIKTPLGLVCAHYSRAKERIAQIKAMARKNDTDVFQFVEFLERELRAINANIATLSTLVSKSGVLNQFKSHECVRGSVDGKRLGLKRLVRDASRNMMDIDATIGKLRDLAVKGVDTNEYVCLANGKAKRM